MLSDFDITCGHFYEYGRVASVADIKDFRFFLRHFECEDAATYAEAMVRIRAASQSYSAALYATEVEYERQHPEESTTYSRSS